MLLYMAQGSLKPVIFYAQIGAKFHNGSFFNLDPLNGDNMYTHSHTHTHTCVCILEGYNNKSKRKKYKYIMTLEMPYKIKINVEIPKFQSAVRLE